MGIQTEQKWLTVQVVAPTRYARQIVEGRFDPLTDFVFVAAGLGPIPDTVSLKAGQAVLQLDVEENPQLRVAVAGNRADGGTTAPLSFYLVSAVAASRARNARIIRATP